MRVEASYTVNHFISPRTREGIKFLGLKGGRPARMRAALVVSFVISMCAPPLCE